MNFAIAREAVLVLTSVWLSGCHGCDARTPVPFKRLQPEAAVPQDAGPAQPVEATGEITTYPEGTQQIRVSDTTIARPDGVIRASLARDLDADKQTDVLIVSTDAQSQAQLEVIPHGSARPSAQLKLSPEPVASGCRAIAARLAPLSSELDLASVDFLCDAPSDRAHDATPVPPVQAVAPAATGATAITATPDPARAGAIIDDAPPEPSAALALTQHFVFALNGTGALKLVLRLCANWSEQGEPVSPELVITGSDVDGDQNGDVQVSLPLTAAETKLSTKARTAAQEPALLTLTWLNRPTGFARERVEPEATLAALAQQAYQWAQKKPEASWPIATRALRLHQLLCKESGAAQLWADDTRGVPCGVSNAAGKAAAANAIALSQTQAVLPALEARAKLDDPGFAIDKKTREQVSQAVGAIRGDTGYHWQMGPALRAGGAPTLHLPLLGFIDENTLLMRGPITQSYDLQTRSSTPTGIAGSVLATSPRNRFVLTDIVRNCDGYHARSVASGQVIGGVVTGPTASEPLLQPSAAGVEPGACSGFRPRSERGGFVLLGMTPTAALFSRGKHLYALPIDAQDQFAEAAREVPSTESLPPLQTPGPLDQSGRFLALATSEGVALIDRARDSARLIRMPASCVGGQVSDAALSPSGRKLAMLCGGRVYVAEPAADSGG